MSIIGVDVGTSALKAVAYGADDGRALATARFGYPSAHPAPGTMELDPTLVTEAFVSAIRSIAGDPAVRSDPVRAMAFSVSCDEVVPVDAAGRPVAPCIMAPDTRGADVLPLLALAMDEVAAYRRTGLPFSPIHPIARILWHRVHRPDVASRAARWLGWAELLLARLGLPAVTDETTAGRWLAYDVVERRWMTSLLDRLEIDSSLLPEVASVGTPLFELPAAAADEMGLPTGVVVVAGAFDQVCAAVGAGLAEPGDTVVVTGTWENATILRSDPGDDAMLTRGITWGRYARPPLFAALVMNPGGGSVLRWFRDELARDEVRTALESQRDPFDVLLASLPAEPTGLLVLPHLQGSLAPWRDPASRGAIVGMTLATTRAELLRGVLEGITYELRLNLEPFESGNGTSPRAPVRNSGGGSRSRAWVQLKADVLGRPVTTVDASEPGCLGAAIIAAVGTGAFSDLAEAQTALCRLGTLIQPDPGRVSTYDTLFAAYRGLYPSLRETLHALAGRG